MNRVSKKAARINERKRMMEQAMAMDPERESRLAAIQMLIPMGLKLVEEELKAEVRELSGERYARGKKMGSWGSNGGSVYVYDQKVRVNVPRVRRKDTDEEVPLMSYVRLQEPQVIEEAALNRVINGISQKKYEKAVLSVPETFGIKKQSISKKWIRASARKLRELMDRDLSDYDIVAMILDGKTFGENEIILALGVTMRGEKVVMGFIEASTENFIVCRDFLRGLLDRGLNTENEILCVTDGSKGLRKAVKSVLGDKAVPARCQWHKRENAVGYLNKGDQADYRRKLQAAYEQPTYDAAKNRLLSIQRELRVLNDSAANSLEEGMEETLTLHRLGMFEKLGTSLKTTNCLENLNRQLGIYTDRVCRWQNSDQRRRWVATALLEIEPNFKKVKGYRHLPELREAMRLLVRGKNQAEMKKAA
jgi:transposase-like protein